MLLVCWSAQSSSSAASVGSTHGSLVGSVDYSGSTGHLCGPWGLIRMDHGRRTDLGVVAGQVTVAQLVWRGIVPRPVDPLIRTEHAYLAAVVTVLARVLDDGAGLRAVTDAERRLSPGGRMPWDGRG